MTTKESVYEWIVWLFVTLLVIGIGAALIYGWIPAAQAHDMKALEDLQKGDSRRSDWFFKLHSAGGSWCCDLSDATQLRQDQARQEADQSWSVYLDDLKKWVPVPPDRVVGSPKSIDGEPYLFRALGPLPDSPYGIRCFVPPIPGY